MMVERRRKLEKKNSALVTEALWGGPRVEGEWSVEGNFVSALGRWGDDIETLATLADVTGLEARLARKAGEGGKADFYENMRDRVCSYVYNAERFSAGEVEWFFDALAESEDAQSFLVSTMG